MNKFDMIGTDSEYFVANKDGMGCAIGLIGGSKQQPKIIPYGNLQEDNVLAEFAIDPVTTKAEWVTNITIVQSHLRGLMNRQKYSLVTKSSHKYTKEQLLSFDAGAMEMGCEEDFNVYANCVNEKPNAYQGLRTAAGHIHFSYANPNHQATAKIIKCLDYMLGLWSVMEDKDTARRELYGKAGSCRIKAYGGEYRTLGNFWINASVNLEYVYDTTKACVEFAEELLPRFNSILSEQNLQGIINGYDRHSAELFYPLLVDVYQEVVCELSA